MSMGVIEAVSLQDPFRASIQSWAIIGSPGKPHLDGV